LEEVVASHVKVTNDATEREVHGTLSPIKRLRDEQLEAIEAAYDAAASFIAVGGEEGAEVREEQAAINDLQIQVGTVVNQMLAAEVQLKTHPPQDLHQDLVGVRNLIGVHGEGMGPETIMQALAILYFLNFVLDLGGEFMRALIKGDR